MKIAHIENGIVTNISLWDTHPDFGVDISGLLVDIGDIYDGVSFSKPPKYATIEAAKAAKHDQIERERDAACYANVSVNGHTWQADTRSQQLLASSILLAQAGAYTPDVWRDANNVDVPVTLTDLVAIAGIMALQTQAAYAMSWTRKQALSEATTIEGVEGV